MKGFERIARLRSSPLSQLCVLHLHTTPRHCLHQQRPLTIAILDLKLNHHFHPSIHSSHRPFSSSSSSHRTDRPQPADDPNWRSPLDNAPILIRSGTSRRHGWGLLVLIFIPVTAFVLGTWQVYRLRWKSSLIAKCEDRLVRSPLPLPPRVDAEALSRDFDYRRVYARGKFRHDLEMLIGPRSRDGESGFMVVTPLERSGNVDGSGEVDPDARVLVNRGWISKTLRDQRTRQDGLPTGEVVVEGLLRSPWKKNMFTPDNRPDKGEFYFPDVHQMAELTGSQPVWVEATMDPDLDQAMEYHNRGIPLGRRAEVNLSNNHAQYIFTWYSLSVATAIMLYMVVKKPSSEITRRVRQNKTW